MFGPQLIKVLLELCDFKVIMCTFHSKVNSSLKSAKAITSQDSSISMCKRENISDKQKLFSQQIDD